MSEASKLERADYEALLKWTATLDLPRKVAQDVQKLVLSTALKRNRLKLARDSLQPFNSSRSGDRRRAFTMREAIQGRKVVLPSGIEYEFGIAETDEDKDYLFVLTLPPTSQVHAFWNCHLTAPELSLFIFERLFFRTGNCYIRSLSVNSDKEQDKERLRQQLGMAKNGRELRPSHHYISSGETAGAIILQNSFADFFGVRARLRSAGTFRRKGNDIVFASPRVGEDILRAAAHFKPGDKGIGPFEDRENGETRIVHVLVRREKNASDVATVISSHHGRAAEGACQKLCDVAWMKTNILPLFGPSQVIPPHFEIVLEVRLKYEALGNTSFADYVEVRRDGFWTPGASPRALE